MPYGQHSKNNNGYIDAPEGANAIIDFGGGSVTTTGSQGKYVNGVKTESFIDGVTNRYNGPNANNGGGVATPASSSSRVYEQQTQEQARAAAAITKQAADNGLARSKDLGGFAEGVANRATKRDFDNDMTAKKEDAAIAKQLENNRAGNTALESNKDRQLAVTSMDAKASEAAKDRASASFDKASANASNLAGIVSTVEGQRDAAKIQGRTAQSGQQAATEQARAAAQAQVSAALLGGKANYGGYW